MQTVLVTGAAGFIGSHTAELFAREGWRVFALLHHRRTPRLLYLIDDRKVEVLHADLGDPEAVRNLMVACRRRAGAPLDAIAHCAGRATDIGRAGAFRRANFEPVRYLGEAVAEGFARRLVYVSTTDVYGLFDHHAATEDATPLRAFPRNAYPLFKILAEDWLRGNVPAALWSIVRPAAVWGPDDPTLAPRILGFLRRSPFIIHFGPWRGRNRWPLAHVDNVAQAILLAATRDEAAGRAVNVLDSERTSIDEFYRLLGRACLPRRNWRTLKLPWWFGQALGSTVSALGNTLNMNRPPLDPSLYALYAVSRDLDFSNARWLEWMTAAGRRPVTREEGLAQLKPDRL